LKCIEFLNILKITLVLYEQENFKGELMLGRKIAYSGTHGTGKSYAVGERFIKEKLDNPTKSVVVISENIRNCPFPINKESTKYSQMWIFSDQMKMELKLNQNTT
jgi:phage terminase large subunit